MAHGKITFEEYLVHFEKVYGKVEPDNIPLYKEYNETTLIPGILEREKRFGKYERSGRLVRVEADMSTELLQDKLTAGKYLFTGVRFPGSSGAHAVSIFRPQKDLPAVMFYPSEEKSKLCPLNKYLFDLITNEQPAFSLISQYEPGR